MSPRMKSVEPNPAHLTVMEDFKAVLTKHADTLSGQEMLALTSQLVGQVLALQDQRTMTGEMCLAVIQINIEMGNAEAVKSVFGSLDPNAVKN